TSPGHRGYAAQFASGNTAGIVMIAGGEALTQEQAFTIFSLAAQPLSPNHMSPGTPTARAGELAMVAGTWARQHVLIGINTDGTGEINLNHGCCSGVTYYLTIEGETSPVTATIVGRSFTEDIDLEDAAGIGDTITLHRENEQNIDVLIVHLPESERGFMPEIKTCRNGGFDPPCAT
ncbi:MAG TPA: hypothetical protein VFL82_14905, partial [Thermomicrobiales bacterium]|nr:hypothetical protein [Thermomicrobiales bacterium]